MKALFVLNPAAGHGRAAERWARVVGEVRALHPEADVWHTRGPKDGAALARRALEQGFEAVVAVGGDGTLGEVVDGFLGAPEAERARAVVGTWPAGSGCDTARHLGLGPDDPVHRLLEMLDARRVRRIDAGRVYFTADDGKPGGVRHFINIAAFGLAGAVARRLEKAGKGWGGSASYLFSSLSALAAARPDAIELVVDGRPEPAVPLYLAALANFSTFGGGMRIAAGADSEDGLFDLVTVGAQPKWRLLLNFPKIYRGTHLGMEGVRHRRARHVEASSAEPVWLNIDGEALGRLPAVFELLPKALPLLVP